MRGTQGRGRYAFTLIELLVVVAIIAVLIAILLPSLGKARERAKLVVCQTHMHGWGLGFIMYASDFNDSLPLDGGDGTTAIPVGKWNDPWLWFNGVVQYTAAGGKTYDELQLNAPPAVAGGAPLPKGGANSLFVCPSALDAMPGTGDQVSNGYFQVVGWYGNTVSPFADTRPMLLCYGMNSQLRQWNIADPGYGNPADAEPGDISKLALLKPASLVPLLAEKRIRPDELPINDQPNYSKNLAQTKVTSNRFAARHNQGGNIVFADGHVEWMNNSKISHGAGANKTNDYNIPGLLIWNPMNQ